MQRLIPVRVETEPPMVLVGCGILHREVECLIRKNGWALETHFLMSALHNYFDKLYTQLDDALSQEERQGKQTLVFYGACHPRMAALIQQHKTLRTQGQNCIVMLLGYEKFMEELSLGAYFLLEDWALNWEQTINDVFGKNPEVVKEIFQASHQYILALRTPCSMDFTLAAEAVAQSVGLPLRWLDVSLEHLESVLGDAINQKQQPER